MIHLQNKGETLEDIIHGLHVENARNHMSAIVSNHKLHEPIPLIGGLPLNAPLFDVVELRAPRP